jgi:hypothetical protein
LRQIGSWSQNQIAIFLAVLAYEITVCARSTYEPGSSSVLDPETLRGFNEIQHRVTASLRDHLVGNKGIAPAGILEMLHDFGTRCNRQRDIEYAVSRAEECARNAVKR